MGTPSQQVLTEMQLQLELATTKCGDLMHQLDMVKDKMKKEKGSNTSLVETEEIDLETKKPDEFDSAESASLPSTGARILRQAELKDSSTSSSDEETPRKNEDIIKLFYERMGRIDEPDFQKLSESSDEFYSDFRDEGTPRIEDIISSMAPGKKVTFEEKGKQRAYLMTAPVKQQKKKLTKKVKTIENKPYKSKTVTANPYEVPLVRRSATKPKRVQTAGKSLSRAKASKKLKTQNEVPKKPVIASQSKSSVFTTNTSLGRIAKGAAPLSKPPAKPRKKAKKVSSKPSMKNSSSEEPIKQIIKVAKKCKSSTEENVEVERKPGSVESLPVVELKTADVVEKVTEDQVKRATPILRKKSEMKLEVVTEKPEELTKPAPIPQKPEQKKPVWGGHQVKPLIRTTNPPKPKRALTPQPKQKIETKERSDSSISLKRRNSAKPLTTIPLEPKPDKNDKFNDLKMAVEKKSAAIVKSFLPRPEKVVTEVHRKAMIFERKRPSLPTPASQPSVPPSQPTRKEELRTEEKPKLDEINSKLALKESPRAKLFKGTFNSIPFIVGKSTSKSYHIGLNIQQTMSLFKLSPSVTVIQVFRSNMAEVRTPSEKGSTAYSMSPNRSKSDSKVPQCPACVNDVEDESDSEMKDDPWSVSQKPRKSDQPVLRCTCLPKRIVSFNQVLSQLLQGDKKRLSKYQSQFQNGFNKDVSTDSIEPERSDGKDQMQPSRGRNVVFYTRLLRSVQELRDTIIKS